MRTRKLVIGGVALVVLVLIAAVGWWRLADHRPRVAVGSAGLVDRFDDHPPHAHTVAVRTPTIRFDLGVGDAVQELPPHCCVEEKADHRAPRGGSFVGVHVATPTTMPWTVALGAQWQRPHLTLVDGARRYPLTGIDDYLSPQGPWTVEGVTAYIALPDKPAHVSVEVEYDGGVQRFDTADDRLDSGVARPLYTLPASPGRSRDCTDDWPAPYVPQRGASVSTAVSRVEVPWVPGLGWAREGRTWLVAGVSRHVPRAFGVRGEQGVLYANDDAPDVEEFSMSEAVREITADGEHPRGLSSATSISLASRVVWDEPAGAHPVIRSRISFSGRLVEGAASQQVADVVLSAVCR